MSTPLNISLSQQGFDTKADLHCNLGTAPLVEAALAFPARGQGHGQQQVGARQPFIESMLQVV
mgnify:CR=1 FL=1